LNRAGRELEAAWAPLDSFIERQDDRSSGSRAARLGLGMVSLKQPSTSSSGNSVFWRNASTMASSAGMLFGAFGPIGASAVVVRWRHFRTVLGFKS
jgi:hypothetical protein